MASVPAAHATSAVNAPLVGDLGLRNDTSKPLGSTT
jgi:hypothetical protein